MALENKTLADVKVNCGIEYLGVKDISIRTKYYEHGICRVSMFVSSEVSEDSILAVQGKMVSAQTGAETPAIYGICTNVSVYFFVGYYEVELEITSSSWMIDQETKKVTFQSSSKTLGAVASSVCNCVIEKDATISQVLYQRDETDWKFILRLAQQFGYYVYQDFHLTTPSLAIGSGKMRTYDIAMLGSEISSQKDVQDLRYAQLNGESSAAYEFESVTYRTSCLDISAGDLVGDFQVVESHIYGLNELLVNDLIVARKEDAHGVAAKAEEVFVSDILTGTVASVEGTNVKVVFDTDSPSIPGGLHSIPYENAMSHSFYCMPDEGDQVFVYYENNGNMSCLGSKRSNTSGPDYGTPDEKVLTSKNHMIRMTGTSVVMAEKRDLHDAGSTSEITITLDDNDGITITSGADVEIKTEGDGSLHLASMSEAELSNISFDKLKDRFVEAVTPGHDKYVMEGGLEGTAEGNAIASGLILKSYGTEIVNSFKNLDPTKAWREWAAVYADCMNPKQKEKLSLPEDVAYDTGVISVYGLNELTMTVGLNGIYMDANVFIDSQAFCWVGYVHYEHEHLEEEYVDPWEIGLDIFQTVLDVVGMFPEPVGLIADLVNAGVSLLRGDFAGAALSLVCAIPGVGQVAAAGKLGKTAANMFKTGSKLSKIAKFIKTASKIYQGTQILMTVVPSILTPYTKIVFGKGNGKTYYELAMAIIKGTISCLGFAEVEIKIGGKKSSTNTSSGGDDNSTSKTSTGDEGDVIKTSGTGDEIDVVKPTGTGNESDVVKPTGTGNESDVVKPTGTGNESDVVKPTGTGNEAEVGKPVSNDVPLLPAPPEVPLLPAVSSASVDGPTVSTDKITTVGDPIDVVSGSLSSEFVDLLEMDVTGTYELKRRYESVYDNRGGALGDKWRFEIESSIVFKDDVATVQLPDLHLEKFKKKGYGWENLREGDDSYSLIEYNDCFKFKQHGANQTFIYSLTGRLCFIIDQNGNRTQFVYEDSLVGKIILASGHSIQFTYRDGKISKAEDDLGRVVSYHYDNNLLTEVVLPSGASMRYEYTREGYLVCSYDLNGNWVIKNSYDRKGRVIKQNLAGGEEILCFYDDAAKKNTWLTTSTGKSIIRYYGNNKLVNRTVYADQTEAICEYDSNNNIKYEKDRRGFETYKIYDEFGHLVEIKKANGLLINYEYDSYGRLLGEWDNAGRRISQTYDANGNLLSKSVKVSEETTATTYYEYDSRGRIVSIIDPRGKKEEYFYSESHFGATKRVTKSGETIYYSYDNAGYLSEVRDNIGSKFYTYNAFGQTVLTKDELGNITRKHYDNMSNLVKLVRPNAYSEAVDDGNGVEYTYDVWNNITGITTPDGAYTAMTGNFYGKRTKVVKPYEMNQPGAKGVTYEYDDDQNCIRIIRQDGATVRMFYDANGNVIKRVTAEEYDKVKDDGNGVTLEYDSENLVSTTYESDGTVIKHFVRDLANNIIKEITTKGYYLADTDDKRPGTLYKYDLLAHVVEKRVPLNIEKDDLTGDIKVSYGLTTYVYDENGNVISERRYLDYQTEESYQGRINQINRMYDDADRLVKVWDSAKSCVEFTYDERNRRVAEKTKISDGVYSEKKYVYAPNGNLLKFAVSADQTGTGKKYSISLLDYDKNGNLVKVTTPVGNEILREYDVCDRVVKETYREKAGSINRVIYYSYDVEGNLSEQKTGSGICTTYHYDLWGNMVSRIQNNGLVISNVYNKNNRIISSEDSLLHSKTIYEYDSHNRLTTIIGPCNAIQKHYQFNQFGEIESEETQGVTVQHQYDYAGRRILTTTEGNSQAKYGYDAAGNMIRYEDGRGNKTVYETDLWGRIIAVARADEGKEFYSYDYAGNMISATDGNGNITKFTYNSLNKLSSREDALGNIETYSYDILGQLHEHTDRDGRRYVMTYNMLGSLTMQKESVSGLMKSFEYDNEGRLMTAIADGKRYDYEYYEDGLLKSKKASGRELISYGYDLLGRKILQKDLTGKETNYSYDVNNRMVGVFENGIQLAGYEYDINGLLNNISLGSNISTSFAYDADHNISSIQSLLGKELLADCKYQYDGNGNRVQKNELSGISTFEYNALDQLVRVEKVDKNGALINREKFEYDKAGNRVFRELIDNSVTGNTIDSSVMQFDIEQDFYSYDACNRLIHLNKVLLAGQTDLDSIGRILDNPLSGISEEIFAYDKQGNLLSDLAAVYEYDGFGRNTKVEKTNGDVQINRYDPEDLRDELEENGKLVRFLYSGQEIIAEENDNQDIIRYVRGLGIICSDSEMARNYYHCLDEVGSHVDRHFYYVQDERSSVSRIVNEDKVLNSYEYDAFGNTVEASETVSNRFRFNGEVYDSISNMYYLRARFYNPVIGRFTQEDTYYGDGLNLYTYVKNNPVKYVDPTGHESAITVNGSGENGGNKPTCSAGDYEAMLDLARNDCKTREDWNILNEIATSYGVDINDITNTVNNEVMDHTPDPVSNNEQYVSWMNEKVFKTFYDKPDATFGAPGHPAWVMSATDAANCNSIGEVARDTGMAGSTYDAYQNGDPYVYGVVVNGSSVDVERPTSSTPGVNDNWSSNGRTAVNGEPTAPGPFVMDTGVNEYIVNGGNPMPEGSFAFRMDDRGRIKIIRRW